jgi:hypothetical protein
MKKDIDDLNVTLDDTSKEIKRLQDELEHCPRRSYEIRAHALIKQRYLRGLPHVCFRRRETKGVIS